MAGSQGKDKGCRLAQPPRTVSDTQGLWQAAPFDIMQTAVVLLFLFFILIFKRILFILERGREGEKHQCAVASHAPLLGVLACNPGTCLDWESNWRPSGLQAGTQSSELQQPGV